MKVVALLLVYPVRGREKVHGGNNNKRGQFWLKELSPLYYKFKLSYFFFEGCLRILFVILFHLLRSADCAARSVLRSKKANSFWSFK